jgi:hypothetical protein
LVWGRRSAAYGCDMLLRAVRCPAKLADTGAVSASLVGRLRRRRSRGNGFPARRLVPAGGEAVERDMDLLRRPSLGVMSEPSRSRKGRLLRRRPIRSARRKRPTRTARPATVYTRLYNREPSPARSSVGQYEHPCPSHNKTLRGPQRAASEHPGRDPSASGFAQFSRAGVGRWSLWQMADGDYPRVARTMRSEHGLQSRRARRSRVRVNRPPTPLRCR